MRINRNLGPRQLEALREKLDTLLKIGMIEPVTDPIWSSPVFMVPKKQKGTFRMVIDMRPLNRKVERTALPFPNLEAQLGAVRRSRWYAQFDVLSGFDMLQTDSDSQHLFGISTVFGVYKLKGAPQGFINTPATYSDRMIREILGPGDLFMREGAGVIQWLDDSLLYANDFESFLETFEQFLINLKSKGVRLSVEKCTFFREQATFCGRNISQGTWKFEDRFYDSILQMKKPETGEQLAQALYTSTWLAPTIPQLSEIASPLRQVLKNIQRDKGSMKLKRIIGAQLSDYGWDDSHDKAWYRFCRAIHSAARLHVYDPKMALCMLSDSSDHFYSGVITQCNKGDLKLPLEKQRHVPLFFLNGEFKEAQRNWHISSKEFFPIMTMFDRFDFLLSGHDDPVQIFCDHHNLKYIMLPNKEISKTTLGRLHRWGMCLQQYDFRVTNVTSEQNFFADQLSRWSSPHNCNRVVKSRSVNVESGAATSSDEWLQFMKRRVSYLHPEYDGPTVTPLDKATLVSSQETAIKKSGNLLKNLERRNDLIYIKGKLFIPTELVEEFVVALHINAGHPARRIMEHTLKDYYLEGVDSKTVLSNLYRVCLHCERPNKNSRRMAHSIPHGHERGKVIHCDFLYVHDHKYLLVLVDDLSRKMELFETSSASAEVVASAILYWKGRYGLPTSVTLVSDQGSHFANSLVRLIAKKLRMNHHFSAVYSPWANGSAEVTNREILRILRTLTSEYALPLQDWPKLIPEVLTFANNKVAPETGLSPNQIYMGLPPEAPPFVIPMDSDLLTPQDPAEVASCYKELLECITDRSKMVFDIREKLRADRRRSLNQRLTIEDIQYSAGDWVLLSSSKGGKSPSKLTLTWRGPYQVLEPVSHNVYAVQSLTGNVHTVHAQRLRYYDGPAFKRTEEVLAQFIHSSKGAYEG